MDFQKLLDDLRNSFSSMPDLSKRPIRTEPGVDYGPGMSMSRITRTPINWVRNMPDNNTRAMGEYDPSTKGISIDPVKANDYTSVAETVRHESIHALLDKLPNEAKTLSSINILPYFIKRIAPQLSPGSNVAGEIPAYLGAQPYSAFKGVSDEDRQMYVRILHQRLQQEDPDLAYKFKRILESGEANPMGGVGYNVEGLKGSSLGTR